MARTRIDRSMRVLHFRRPLLRVELELLELRHPGWLAIPPRDDAGEGGVLDAIAASLPQG